VSRRHPLLLGLLVGLILVGLVVSPARAGTYEVGFCEGASALGEGNDTSSVVANSSNEGNAAATDRVVTCPRQNTGDISQGISARGFTTSATTPNGGYRAVVFRPPAGARIVGGAIAGRLYSTSGWTAAFDTDNSNTGWSYTVNGSPAGGATGPEFGVSGVGITFGDGGVFGPVGFTTDAGQFYELIQCRNASGCLASDRLVSNAWHLRLTIRDDTAPALGVGGNAFDGAWHAGSVNGNFSASDNSGVRLVRAIADNSTVVSQQNFTDPGWDGIGVRCHFNRMAPCPGSLGGYLPIDTTQLADGSHSFHMDTFDAAMNGTPAAVGTTLHVDNTPPAAPNGLTVAGGQGWRPTDGFDISLNAPAEAPDRAPRATAEYQLCPVNTPANCTTGSQTSASGIAALSNVHVTNPGDYVLRARLIDAAGNRGEYGGQVHLRYDPTVPGKARPAERNGWLNPADRASGEPIRLAATGDKGPSGIAGYSVTTDGTTPDSSVDITGELANLDLTRLAEGVYLVRAIAISGADPDRPHQASRVAARGPRPTGLATRRLQPHA
jgi:hypothetical protein